MPSCSRRDSPQSRTKSQHILPAVENRISALQVVEKANEPERFELPYRRIDAEPKTRKSRHDPSQRPCSLGNRGCPDQLVSRHLGGPARPRVCDEPLLSVRFATCVRAAWAGPDHFLREQSGSVGLAHNLLQVGYCDTGTDVDDRDVIEVGIAQFGCFRKRLLNGERLVEFNGTSHTPSLQNVAGHDPSSVDLTPSTQPCTHLADTSNKHPARCHENGACSEGVRTQDYCIRKHVLLPPEWMSKLASHRNIGKLLNALDGLRIWSAINRSRL